MKTFNEKIIDSHVHLDHIYARNPNKIAWMKERKIMTVSWAWASRVETSGELKAYLQNQADTIHQLYEDGFKCFFLTGIHPRNIPEDLKVEDVKDILSPFLEHPLCLGIGEIGLETASSREEEIFSAQIDMVNTLKSMGKRIGVHTPRNNKSQVTEKILSVLKAYPGIEDMTVIDHCTSETVGLVLESGYWAGITLSPIKTSLQNLERIIQEHSEALNRIMCNTDSGTSFYEDLWELYNSEIFPADIINRLVFENADRFF